MKQPARRKTIRTPRVGSTNEHTYPANCSFLFEIEKKKRKRKKANKLGERRGQEPPSRRENVAEAHSYTLSIQSRR